MSSRDITHNPLYRAFKAKSFTDKDITLHFILMDILADGQKLTTKELLGIIDEEYLCEFDNPMNFDESTLRKKLKEYLELGLVKSEKDGKQVRYFVTEHDICFDNYREAIRFFTEENILGVVGSFIEDKMEKDEGIYTFKNHFIMNAYDAEIVEKILQAIHERKSIKILNVSRRDVTHEWHIIPLKIYVSTSNGRQHLIARGKHGQMLSFRIDYIKEITLEEENETYDEALKYYESKLSNLWGVNISEDGHTDHIEMDIQVNPGEEHIIRRLNREKRCGTVTQIDEVMLLQ